MILHAASIAAFFVDQLEQAPVQIQCVQQAATESWLKQWIPTTVSLLSIGVGVWIARWSFRVSSEREHEQWILDQKKAEWKNLLSEIAACEKEIVSWIELPLGKWTVNQSLKNSAQDLLASMRGTLFIYPAIEGDKFINPWDKLIKEFEKKHFGNRRKC